MELILMSIMTNMIDTLLIFYALRKILSKKRKNLRKSIIVLLFLTICGTIINKIFGQASLLGFIIVLLISTLGFAYLLEQNFYKILIHCIFIIILMATFEIIIINVISIIFKVLPSDMLKLNTYRVLGIIMTKGGFYLFIKFLVVRRNIPEYINNNDDYKIIISIGVFNILIIFMIFSSFIHIKERTTIGNLYLVGMGLGSVIFSWMIYSLVKKVVQQANNEIIWKIKDEEFRKKDFYLKSMDDILHTIKSQRHDLNNYLSTLYGLIYLESYGEAKSYITKINDKFYDMHDVVETNHPVITALVSMKKNRAFKDNIDMKLNINLPEQFVFDYIDLSIIIGNLLDNAIEACQLIVEKERKIQANIYIEDNNLIIYVINTKTESIKTEIENIFGRYTTKKDKENHGLGLGNVKSVVREYGGSLDIQDLGDQFKVNIEIPLGIETKREEELTTYSI